MTILVNLDVMLAIRKKRLTDLSKAIGITLPNLSILKNQKAKAVRLATLNKICAYLECQPGDILVYEPDPVAPNQSQEDTADET